MSYNRYHIVVITRRTDRRRVRIIKKLKSPLKRARDNPSGDGGGWKSIRVCFAFSVV